MNRVPKWSLLGEAARILLARIDGKLTLTELSALTGIDESDVELTLSRLASLGLIVVSADVAGSRVPSIPPRPASGVMERVRPGPPADGFTEARARDLRSIAQALDKLGDFTAASEAWSSLADHLPLDAGVHDRLARSLLRARTQYRKAVASALHAVELAPENGSYRVTLVFGFLAVGLFPDALREAETAAALDPDNEELARLLADLRDRTTRAAGGS